MDNLATGMLAKILSNLNLNTMLACRLLSKTWKFVIENNVMIRNLQTSQDVQFATRNYDFVQADFFRSKILNNLRSLFINKEIQGDAFLNSVNRFAKLEQLHIECDLIIGQPGTIRLPNLQYLTIRSFGGPQLVLDTPALHSFKSSFSYSGIKFNYEEKIESLSLEKFESDVTKFKNLVYLYVQQLKDDDAPALIDLLSTLPKLRELHFGNSNDKNIAHSIMLSKERLKRSDLRIYYCGILIDNLEDLDELTSPDGRRLIDLNENTQLITRCYSKLTYCMPWIYVVNYSVLVNHFSGRIERNFHDRFYNILKFEVSQRVEYQEQFIKFIKKYPQMRDLDLSSASLDQSFYDQLPTIRPNIVFLRITDQVAILEFIFHLKELKSLFLEQQVTCDFIVNFLNRERFCDLDLGYKNERIIVRRRWSYIEIELAGHTKKFKDVGDVLSYLQNLI